MHGRSAWIIDNSLTNAIDVSGYIILYFLTIIADPSILVSVSLTHNGFSIIKSEIHSHLLKSNNHFIRCYVSIPISINLIEDLRIILLL